MARHALIRNPAIFAVISSEPVLHDKRFARVVCCVVRVEALQIVWMHTLSPAMSDLLLQGSASKLQPRFVEESAEFIRPGHPDHHGRSIGHVTKSRFALH